jgi:hypothetical protein
LSSPDIPSPNKLPDTGPLFTEAPLLCGVPPLEAQEASYFAAADRTAIFSPRSITILYTCIGEKTRGHSVQGKSIYFLLKEGIQKSDKGTVKQAIKK